MCTFNFVFVLSYVQHRAFSDLRVSTHNAIHMWFVCSKCMAMYAVLGTICSMFITITTQFSKVCLSQSLLFRTMKQWGGELHMHVGCLC